MRANPHWKPIIVELTDLINSEKGWTTAFDYAVKEAISYDIDLEGIKDTYTYCEYMNDLLSWIPTENMDGNAIYRKICISYFILDQPALAGYQTPIHPASADQPLTRLSQWIVKYAQTLGTDWLDTPASITPDSIQSFYDTKSYNMDDYIQPPGGWKTFNEFFARHLKPGKRPIDGENDPGVVVSAADSVFDGHWSINDDLVEFTVKGVPWSIKDLLKGSKYADAFKNGTFMHSYLSTNDYHRQHAPISGTVVEAYNINGAAYLEVVVKDDNEETIGYDFNRQLSSTPTNRLCMQRKLINKKPSGLGAPDKPGYQFLQLRAMIVIDSPIGLVAVLPIGMDNISSVVITCKEGQVLKKGDEISYVQFGGSDIVMVFEEGSNLNFTADVGTHYNVGKQIGIGSVPDVAKSGLGRILASLRWLLPWAR